MTIPPSPAESLPCAKHKRRPNSGVLGALRRLSRTAFASYGLYRRPRNSTGPRPPNYESQVRGPTACLISETRDLKPVTSLSRTSRAVTADRELKLQVTAHSRQLTDPVLPTICDLEPVTCCFSP